MSEPGRVEGVWIGGNAQVSGPVAGGRYARAEQYNAATGDQLRAEMEALRGLLRTHRNAVAEPERVERDLTDLAEEAAQPAPDRDRLTDTINRIGRRVAAVAALAAGVEKLRELVL
jgi:hypothetical protein